MSLASDGRWPAAPVCLAQGAIGVVAASVALIGWGLRPAYASLYGALVAVLPTAYFGWRAFAVRAVREPRRLAAGLARAELGKWFGTALLFLGGVAWFAHEYLALIVTYMACFAAYPLVMLRGRGH